MHARREALGLSQAKLAEKVDINANYVGVLERGLKLPTLDPLVVLAKALGIPVSELLSHPWLEEAVTVAATMPKSLRPIALALLRVMVVQK